MPKRKAQVKESQAEESETVIQELNDRQRAFVEFYLISWNAADAARKAGYSDKAARQHASYLLSNHYIQDAITLRVKELGATADEVIVRLTDHARGSVEYFLDENDDLDLAGARKKGKLSLIKKLKRTRRTEHPKDGEPVTVTTLELELYDAQNAIVQLGRILGLFVDKVEIKDWREAARKAGHDPEQVFKDMVAAARLRLGEPSSSGGVGGSTAPSRPSAGGDG